jgi:hypothetical protein
MDLDAYRSARQQFERFIVAPGHEVELIDTVVERHERFWIVDKQRSAIELAREASAGHDEG